MKAWEMRGAALGCYNVQPPQPGKGDVLIRISHAGVCGSDAPKLSHPNDFTVPDPWRPGRGIVGADPTNRTVAVDPLIPCGDCVRCSTGDTNLCPGLRRLGWDLPGGFAEQIFVPSGNTHPLPDGLDPLQAVLADPAAVAVHGLRCNPVNPPGNMAIIGAGTIGLLTALKAQQQG